MTISKRIYCKSRWLHKWLGLFLVLFLSWMSISGILLNHPDLIAPFSVPRYLVPHQYHPHNWNRSGLIAAVDFPDDSKKLVVGGKLGIWFSQDGGYSFTPFMTGLPQAPYYRKTYDLAQIHNSEWMLAGTESGLYRRKVLESTWVRLALTADNEPVHRIIPMDNSVLVFTDSHIYSGIVTPDTIKFKDQTPAREESDPAVPLVDLFFNLHDGSIWGLPGKLLIDALGLSILFLSVSAVILWIAPSLYRKKGQRSKRSRLIQVMNRYHLQLGIWLAVLLLISGGTGLFLRPPPTGGHCRWVNSCPTISWKASRKSLGGQNSQRPGRHHEQPVADQRR